VLGAFLAGLIDGKIRFQESEDAASRQEMIVGGLFFCSAV